MNNKDIMMNDKEYLNDILESEKNQSTNLSIALNEMSNKDLYNKVFKMFKSSKDNAKDLFELMYKKGWYTLESAPSTKIKEEYDKLSNEIKELEL